jgi:hypothetical protein
MRILHILNHSLPLRSGYTFRTAAILREQQRLGWETFHLTGAKQGPAAALEETAEGLHFFRTPVETAAWMGALAGVESVSDCPGLDATVGGSH